VILEALEKAVPYRRQNFENNDILEIALIQTSLAVLAFSIWDEKRRRTNLNELLNDMEKWRAASLCTTKNAKSLAVSAL